VGGDEKARAGDEAAVDAVAQVGVGGGAGALGAQVAVGGEAGEESGAQVGLGADDALDEALVAFLA